MQPKRESLITPPPEYSSPPSSTISSDWRAQLQPDARQRIVNKIMDTLKKQLPVSGQEGLHVLWNMAQRFEERIFTAATSQSEYLRKISLKMLTMETKSQGTTMANNIPPNPVGPSNKPPDPGLYQVHNQWQPNQQQQQQQSQNPQQYLYQQQLYQSEKPLRETSSNEMAPKMKRSKLAKLVSEAEKSGIIPSILKDWRNENERLEMTKSTDGKTSKKLEKVLEAERKSLKEADKTIVDTSTQVNGLELQVKGLESEVEKLKTDKASLQEEVINLKKINTDLEAANHEYEVKAAVDFAAGFAEAIAQVQVLAPEVDVSEAHYTKEIRDGQLIIASDEDEGDGHDEEDTGKKLVDVQDDQIHAVMKNGVKPV